jgi:hypothetical protein
VAVNGVAPAATLEPYLRSRNRDPSDGESGRREKGQGRPGRRRYGSGARARNRGAERKGEWGVGVQGEESSESSGGRLQRLGRVLDSSFSGEMGGDKRCYAEKRNSTSSEKKMTPRD